MKQKSSVGWKCVRPAYATLIALYQIPQYTIVRAILSRFSILFAWLQACTNLSTFGNLSNYLVLDFLMLAQR